MKIKDSIQNISSILLKNRLYEVKMMSDVLCVLNSINHINEYSNEYTDWEYVGIINGVSIRFILHRNINNTINLSIINNKEAMDSDESDGVDYIIIEELTKEDIEQISIVLDNIIKSF